MEDIGKGAYAMIAEMVAALNVDYGRLEALREERLALSDAVDDAIDDSEGDEGAPALIEARVELAAWREANDDEFAELEAAAGECKDRDDALERIQEDALCVEVRSGWTPIGDTLTAEEFAILITTSGPAVRIRGELDEDSEPRRAWLETQDWGTPWSQYFGASQDVLLDYARCFYFGE